jgi:Tfp pilus assembly protein PilO
MGNLQNHVRWFIRAQWALGALMVALLVAFFAFGYRPQTARLRQLQLDISQRQYELRQSQDKTRILPAIAADVKSLRQQLDASKKLPPQQELPQFLKDVTALGQRCSLHPFTFKQGMPTHGDLFCELPVALTFEGDFIDAFNFLRSTEAMQRLTRVRSMTIKAMDGTAGRVQVQVSMNIYFAPDSSAAH